MSTGRTMTRNTGNPNDCSLPYTPAMYLGLPGKLTQLRLPDQNYSRVLDDNAAVHGVLDGQGVDRSPLAVRNWTMNHQWLTPDVMSVLMEYATRQRGIGPFIFIDPQSTNQFTPNQASGTDSLRMTTGFSVGAQSASVTDTFTRTVTNGWGTADTGQTYAINGTATQYSVTGEGRITPTSLNTNLFAVVTSDNGADRTVQIDVMFTTQPATNALGIGVVSRYVDASNNYHADLRWNSDGSTTLAMYKIVAGAQTTLGFVNMGTNITANTWWTLKMQSIGTTHQVRAWVRGTAEPTFWNLTFIDGSVTTGKLAGALGKNESAVNTHILHIDNLISTASSETLTSSSAQAFQGTQSLAWTLPGAVTSGVLSFIAPTDLFGWATPSGAPWAFQGQLLGGGNDGIVTVTPVWQWMTALGAVTAQVSGTAIVTNTSTWQGFCVTGTAPQDGFLNPKLVITPASSTDTGIVYVDALQLEISSIGCTPWQYGQGQPLVSVQAGTESVPRILRSSMSYALVEVT
jgi:hypothetical protein